MKKIEAKVWAFLELFGCWRGKRRCKWVGPIGKGGWGN